MNVQNLAVILQGALSENCDERKAAEGKLHQIEHEPQHLLRLLRIIVVSDFDLAVKHLASISFKNIVVKNWAPNVLGEKSKILPADKAAVRENTPNIIALVPSLLRTQLGVGLDTIIAVDYPKQWPNLLHWVKQKLQSQQVYGAVFVLRLLSNRFELDEEKTLVHQIVEETFPSLLNIFKKNVQIVNPLIEVADLIKLICKIFLSSIYEDIVLVNVELKKILDHVIVLKKLFNLSGIQKFEIPKKLFDPNVFNAWMICFLIILEKSVPLDRQPVDPEQSKSWEWWKVKKCIIHILNRLYICFGESVRQNPDNKAFAQRFRNKFAVKILDCYLNLLDAIRVGGYLPDKLISSILKYLTSSILDGKVYEQLQLRLDVVLFELIFPLLCFNDNDQVLWDEDPYEYIRKQNDFTQDLYPKKAAIDFLNELIRVRRKENLPKFVKFCYKVFDRYNEAAAEQKPFRQKDGAIFTFGLLWDNLKYTEPYRSELELVLKQHVFPEFRSTAGHLRAKAAWVTGHYADFSYSDPNNFRLALKGVAAGISDVELPVRVDSAIALCSFVEACDGPDLAEIRPIIPQLLDEFIKHMNEVENEDLVYTLITTVEKFGEEIAPQAIGLCQDLAATFWKCIDTAEEENEDAAAGGCLCAIRTALEAVSSFPELFPCIEPTLLPIMRMILNPDIQDFFGEIFEVIACMTYFSPTISLEMWSLWPLLVESLTDWAVDFFPSVFVPLANYISRSTTHFLTCKEPDYQQSLWNLISTVMDYENLDENDITLAPKLIQVVLQNCRGQVDHWIEHYLKSTLLCICRTGKPNLKCLFLKVVAGALYYNASLVLNVLRRLDAATGVFNLWFQLLRETEKSGILANFKKKEDKKICCLGLTSLFHLPENELPLEELERVFKSTVDILIAYKDQHPETSEEEDGEADELERFTDRVNLVTPDDEDPFVFFLDTAKAMQASDSDRLRFEKLMQKLDLNYHKNVNIIGQYAEKRRMKIEEEKLSKPTKWQS